MARGTGLYVNSCVVSFIGNEARVAENSILFCPRERRGFYRSGAMAERCL